ncbi:sulfatase [Paludisphaera mucosa]|uniref:Sulfatase n=1 Tax=Paludisphaera mucosa TaxID=3030827 RepID=A0ABT6FBZ3_9BACT|nr:sulfatase [Paludisphaera mucosa]MDG3005076.1 sulfatase [Paludisphaera mucosa]
MVGRGRSSRLPAALDAFRTALWFGLAAGFVELLLLVLRVEVQEGGFILRSRHFVWMVPTSVLILFAAEGGFATALVAWAGPRASARRAVLGLYVFTAFLGWFLLVRGLEAVACGLIALGFAARGAPWLDARREGLRRVVDRSLPTLGVVLAGLAVASFVRDAREAFWRDGDVEEAPSDVRNVLLVVLDTVRADHLSLYGYDRETTPNLARLARESTVFDQARAAASWTLPSHATLFTGRWPGELSVERRGWLDGSAPTVAERFRDAGFATAGFVANPFFCGRGSGLARGFQVYADYPITPGEVLRSSSLGWLLARSWLRLNARIEAHATAGAVRDVDLDFSRKDAAAVSREFLGWLGRNGGRPFFAFLNLFDAHDPYIPPPGFDLRFGRSSRPDTPHLLRDWQRVDKAKLTPGDVHAARDAYDDCLAALDAQLGDLIESLRARGVLDRTVLIVTADHGEQFGEHGGFGHGLSLYDEEVRVPLLIRAPGLVPAGRVERDDVSLRDVAATALDLSGVPIEMPPLPGDSLAARLRGEGPGVISPAFSELLGPVDERVARPAAADDPASGPWESVVVDGRVYIRRGDGRESLYDLATDPSEARDRSDDPALAEALEAGRRAVDQLISDTR